MQKLIVILIDTFLQDNVFLGAFYRNNMESVSIFAYKRLYTKSSEKG